MVYRTATTTYPCCLPTLGEFSGSWSYTTYPVQRYKKSERIKTERQEVFYTLKNTNLVTGCQQYAYGHSGSFFTFQEDLSAYTARRGSYCYGPDLCFREIGMCIKYRSSLCTYPCRKGRVLLVVPAYDLTVLQAERCPDQES